jgi:hypothetical protein
MNRLNSILLCTAFVIIGKDAIAAAAGFYIADHPLANRYAIGVRIDAKGVIKEIGVLEKAGEKEWRLVAQTINSSEKERFTITWDQDKASKIYIVKSEIKVTIADDVRVSVSNERVERDKERKDVVARAGTEAESKLRLKLVNQK